MLKKEIGLVFTEKVAEYMAKGYVMNIDTMSGSQGEIAKVDLRKGDEIIRILVATGYDHLAEKISVIVGRNTSKLYNRGHDTIWNSELEIIEEIEWYKVSENYYCDEAEYRVIEEKRFKRFDGKRTENTIDFGEEAKKILLPWVKRKKGCKTAKLSDITRVYKYKGRGTKWYYAVNVRGNRFFLNVVA